MNITVWFLNHKDEKTFITQDVFPVSLVIDQRFSWLKLKAEKKKVSLEDVEIVEKENETISYIGPYKTKEAANKDLKVQHKRFIEKIKKIKTDKLKWHQEQIKAIKKSSME
jgi:hypothetical protein